MLDVGCGAGVLAIAAAKVLHQKVWLGDIDPVAVAVANANARLNGAGPLPGDCLARRRNRGAPQRRALRSRLRQHSGRPLRRLAPSLAAVLSRHGEAIVSGLLAADVPGALAAWRAQGLFLAERIDLEGWASLRLKR